MKFRHKIAVIGDRETGKTTFCRNIAHLDFLEEYVPTEGKKSYAKVVPRKDDMPAFTLDINEVSGAKEDRVIIPVHVLPADTVLMFFDHSKPDSLTNLKTHYLDEPRIFSKENTRQLRILVGNQQDETQTFIDEAIIDSLKKDYNLSYFSINAKTGAGINDLKTHIIKHAIDLFKNDPSSSTQIDNQNKRLAHAKKKYDKMWIEGEPIKSIKNILNDYAQEASFFKLLWGCHLGRPHTKEVSKIAQSINDSSSYKEIIDKVNTIPKSNNSELAECIAYISEKENYISPFINEQEPAHVSSFYFC